MRTPVIHKLGRETVNIYVGFGQYQDRPTTLCRGAKGYWTCRTNAYMHRNWKYVNCKRCLQLREEQARKKA